MTKHRHPGHRLDPSRDPRTGEPVPGSKLLPRPGTEPEATEEAQPETEAGEEQGEEGGEGSDAGEAAEGDTAGT